MPEHDSRQVEAMEKLSKLIEQSQLYGFDEEDIAALRRTINLVRGFDALGSFAGFIKNTLVYIGFIIGTIIAVRNGAIDFVMSVMDGKP